MSNWRYMAQAITNVFETGRPDGDYSALVVLPDGGGISYGRSQCTEGSGSLDTLIYMYIDAGGKYANSLRPYLNYLDDKDISLTHDSAFRSLLIKAGNDPVMQACQDRLFFNEYWKPAMILCESIGVVFPLTKAFIYDTSIHSGLGRIAKLRKTFAEPPPNRGGREKHWATSLIDARFNWLSEYTCSDEIKQRLIRSTAWRASVFKELSNQSNWYLDKPIVIRGITIGG